MIRCVCMYVCMYVCNIYIYIYIYVYIHIYYVHKALMQEQKRVQHILEHVYDQLSMYVWCVCVRMHTHIHIY
jgi:hypothetical protein